MKKLLVTLILAVGTLFGYNFTGTWVNQSPHSINDPVKLKISGTKVTPYIKRGNGLAKLKTKNATDVGGALFEAWGFGNKNLVLYIKPINSTKIKVIEKKIDVKRKKILTKVFTFKNKSRVSANTIKRRFVGTYRNNDRLSALSKVVISNVNGNLYVKAWRHGESGSRYLGSTKARIVGNKLYTKWRKGNLLVNATISGVKLKDNGTRYRTIRIDIKAKNLRTGYVNRQTIYLTRTRPNVDRPFVKHIKVGPMDINLLINSY